GERRDRDVAQRDSTAGPGEHRQPEQGDVEHPEDREVARAEGADEAGQHGDDRDQREKRADLERRLQLHTRLTVTLPKRPPGRTSSSTRISSRAAGSFSVEPMKPT